jgi:glycosyltransferase involved in cell wall biosynthesis
MKPYLLMLANLREDGGIVSWFAKMLPELKKQYSVVVVSPEFCDRALLFSCSSVDLIKVPILKASCAFGIIPLIKIIHQYNPRNIVCHELLTSPVIVLFNLFMKYKIFIIVHSWISEALWSYRYKNSMMIIYLKLILKNTVTIVTVSRSLETKMRYFKKQVQTINNGVRTNEIKLRNHGLVRNVIFLGRISYEKGPDKYADLAYELLNNDIKLSIAGDGPYLKMFDEQIKEKQLINIKKLGWVEVTKEFWCNYDALILTSRTEGLPFSVIEAMAHGIPVISFSVGGLPYLLQDGKNGYLCDSVNDMASLLKIGSTKGLPNVNKKCTSALEYIKINFSFEQMADKYISILSK